MERIHIARNSNKKADHKSKLLSVIRMLNFSRIIRFSRRLIGSTVNHAKSMASTVKINLATVHLF